MGFHEDNGTNCPKCGFKIPPGNAYCGKCGSPITRVESVPIQGPELERESPPARQFPAYQRKYSVLQRFTKLVTSPREAMTDIGHAPDYGGVVLLFVVWIIISTTSAIIMLSKMQFTGTYSSEMTSGLAMAATLGLVLAPIIMFVRWLVKSFMIRFACESKNWDYETAASVTGYAYLPNIIYSFLWIFVVVFLIPTITVDTTNLEQAIIDLQMYNAQLAWITLGLGTLGSILVLFWKSYLGGLGAFAGTHESCSERDGMLWFLAIGFIGLIIDLSFSLM